MTQLSRSYPYLDISRKWALPYCEVLYLSDHPGHLHQNWDHYRSLGHLRDLADGTLLLRDLMDAALLREFVCQRGMQDVDQWQPTYTRWSYERCP